jgi:hypothetical protein
MIVVTEKIMQFFSGNSIFTTTMGTKLYPIVAPEKTSFPFTTYSIDRIEAESKDKDAYNITLYVRFGKDEFTRMAQFMEDILPPIKNEFDWQGSTIDFIEDDMSYVGIINFLI